MGFQGAQNRQNNPDKEEQTGRNHPLWFQNSLWNNGNQTVWYYKWRHGSME